PLLPCAPRSHDSHALTLDPRSRVSIKRGWMERIGPVMRSCHVAIPSGVRPDSEGRLVDFESIYRDVLKPAVREMDIDCRRLEEYDVGAIWHKTLITAILTCDLMIADVSTHNANVLYELGIRHAMRR